MPTTLPQWYQLPTVLEVESAFRRTATNRAFFEVISRLPMLMTRAFYPLLLKQAAFQQEAILYKGGRLVLACLCDNYRSLFISSVIGKALRRIYRQEPHSVFV